MSHNRLQQLATFDQSIWLDYIRRNLIASGELRQLIEEDWPPRERATFSRPTLP